MLENNKAIVRRLVEAMDAGDLSILNSVCAPGFLAHFMKTELNLEQVREAAAAFNAAFPDLKHDIQDLVAENDRVFLRAVDTATHRGLYKGIPATHRKVQFETMAIYRIEEGKIAEVWQQMDVHSLLRQLREG